MRKRCIFTYSNHQINKQILFYHKKVCDVLNLVSNCDYQYLNYNAPDGVVTPDQAIDKGLSDLFFMHNYDTILMLDIDCIPLSTSALIKTFERAEQGTIVGNIQRSNHLNNGKHVYVAPSCICISRDVFEEIGCPSFHVTPRGDIGEELTYIARDMGISVDMYMPKSFQALPCDSKVPWKLGDGMPEYGIGTTFIDANEEEMFYHLFQSRAMIFDELFYKKCIDVLVNVFDSNSNNV